MAFEKIRQKALFSLAGLKGNVKINVIEQEYNIMTSFLSNKR
jgi:hypothetical protein